MARSARAIDRPHSAPDDAGFPVWRIREAGYGYCYQAPTPALAIARWIDSTFLETATATAPDHNGRFSVLRPGAKPLYARIERQASR